MISLPGAAMRHISDFLDPIGKAKMAQTSRAWRTIAYRPSTWEKHLWVIAPHNSGPDVWLDSIPTNARHIGEPTKLCFVHWAHQVLARKVSVPRQINYHTDAKLQLKALYTYWCENGRPCIHINHHLWTDVFRGRAWLPDLSPADTQRIMQRLIRPYDPRSLTNAYAKWVKMQVKAILPFPHREIDLSTDVRSAVLTSIMQKIHQKETALKTVLGERWTAMITALNAAGTALTRISSETFEHNERECMKDAIWDAVAFHCGSSDDGPADVSDQSIGATPAAINA
jgi:hypothetical protein